MLRTEVEQEFRRWLRATAARKGLTQASVAWMLPFQVHPNTVETWFRGRGTPSYYHLVGLCSALEELPPSLLRLSPAETAERE